MKIALINSTGSRELPFLAEFVERGHHIVYIAPTPLPNALHHRHTHPTRIEHHRIGLNDTRQLVTALQHCDLAILCQTNLPVMTPAQQDNLTAACNHARVPQLININLARPHPLPRPATTHTLAQPFLVN